MNRRRFLALVAAGGTAGLAGCNDARGTEPPPRTPTTRTRTPTPTTTRVPADPITLSVVDAPERSYTLTAHAVQEPLAGLRVFYADGGTRRLDTVEPPAAALEGAVSLAPLGASQYSVTLDENAGRTSRTTFGGGGATVAVVYAVTVETADGPALGGWDTVTCEEGRSVHRVDVGVDSGRFFTRGVGCVDVGG